MAGLVFDIETVPTQVDAIKEIVHSKVKHPRTLKKADSIAAWYGSQDHIDAADTAWSKTALSTAFGEICAIGWGWVDDGVTSSIVRTAGGSMTEKELLTGFFSRLSEESQLNRRNGYIDWIGHNIVSFDMPFLLHRLIITGASLGGVYLPKNLRPTGNRGVFDTMTEWSGWGKKISLNDLALALGIEQKTMEATMVFDLFDEGDSDTISEYVESDVRITMDIYKRIYPYF